VSVLFADLSMIDKKSIIYTAIAGGYDTLKPPIGAGEGDYDSPLRIAFMDNVDVRQVGNRLP
jgi:hypothetical protein